jgi:hypothetical protein
MSGNPYCPVGPAVQYVRANPFSSRATLEARVVHALAPNLDFTAKTTFRNVAEGKVSQR